MMKALVLGGLALAVLTFSTGCDELALSSAAAGLDKYLPAAKWAGNGAMDQTQDQLRDCDQLRDGTGENCKLSGLQKQNGGGQGDMLRLRDGSCLQ